MGRFCLGTGQGQCYSVEGEVIPCAGSGQDAEFKTGLPWPEPRFEIQGEVVKDRLTGLVWSGDGNPAGLPLTWSEALTHVHDLNQTGYLDGRDWRLPNSRELTSLLSFADKNPALPAGHPFQNVFLGWHWTSTSWAGNPAYAWYVHLEGGRMFFGKKDMSYLVWPVRGPGSLVLPQTGQTTCFDDAGRPVGPQGTGQDGELRLGVAWPRPRFIEHGVGIRDELTRLTWTREADLADGPVDWAAALEAVRRLNETSGRVDWRLPTINELESLVDASRHSPALPVGHPFRNPRDVYWSSTTSSFEPDWAMALYLDKGAIGVAQKGGSHGHVWAVSG